ncbi:hypothetical protein AALC17_15050 [Oscillospiraceae bacterium 38-13]
MLQQTTIPKTPDEVAASLSTMTEAEQCIVKGVIIGLNEAHREIAVPPSPEAERPSA